MILFNRHTAMRAAGERPRPDRADADKLVFRTYRGYRMNTVNDLLATKGSEEVFSVSGDTSVLEAARKMNQHKIGALVIIHNGRVKGIFTERDVLRRVVAEQLDPGATKVDQVMTTEIACCRTDTPIEEAKSVMKSKRIRHLPVVGDDMQLHGMISIGDLNAHQVNNQEIAIHYLNEYLYGRT